MRYLEVSPPPSLRPFVRCLWLVEDEAGPGALERVLPDGCVELVVHYGHPMARLEGSALLEQRGALVAGQLRTAMQLQSTGPIGMVGARFEPWAAGGFLRESLAGLTSHVVPLDAVWGVAAVELEERTCMAKDDASRLRLLADAIERRLLAVDATGMALSHAVGWIAKTRGTIQVSEIASRLQWSVRRLQRQFEQRVGLAPKELCRIERFQNVVQRLGLAAEPRLVDLAGAAGYADQAHLAREFKSLAGLTVTRYLAEQHALSDSFTANTESWDPLNES